MPKKRLPANKKIKRGRELSESDDLFLQSCEVALEKILDKEGSFFNLNTQILTF